MAEPLEVLRRSDEPIAPRAEFAADLLDRVRDALASDPAPPRVAAAPSPGSSTVVPDDVMDEALELLRATGPEFDPYGRGFCLANHAPMTAEALCALGRMDAVMPRTERYRKYLSEAPRAWNSINRSEWREAVGDFDRAGDWVVFFDAELAESPWTEVLERWVPRLAAGGYGSGTHTVLRAAHAARSLGRAQTPGRLHELAEGLAFWAARYETLPETVVPTADLLPSAAFVRVEQLPEHDRSEWLFFSEPLAKLRTLDSFASVTDLVDPGGDPGAILTDLSRSYAALLVTNAATVPARALVHGLTAGSATRMLLPYLSPHAAEVSLRYGWQIAAAFYAALVLEPPATTVEAPHETVDELIDEAIACGDEHAIKVLEVCLREHALDPDPVYLIAARETTRALVRTGLSLP